MERHRSTNQKRGFETEGILNKIGIFCDVIILSTTRLLVGVLPIIYRESDHGN